MTISVNLNDDILIDLPEINCIVLGYVDFNEKKCEIKYRKTSSKINGERFWSFC